MPIANWITANNLCMMFDVVNNIMNNYVMFNLLRGCTKRLQELWNIIKNRKNTWKDENNKFVWLFLLFIPAKLF